VLRPRHVTLLAAVAAAGLVATGCSDQAAAIRVDDVSVSRADFEEELDLYFDHDDLRTFVFGEVAQEDLRGELGTDHSFRQDYVGAVASLRVQFIVADGLLESEGLELTDEARVAARDAIAQQLPGGLDSVPEDYLETFVDDVATFTVLQDELGQEGFATAMGDALADAGVTVSSRYGSWDSDQLTVVPPAGTTPQGGSGADGGDQPAPPDEPSAG
jgi:hypothetical protein